MPWAVAGAAIAAAGSIGGAAMSSSAAGKGASAQEASAANTLGFQQQVYGNLEQQLTPYVTTGTQALNAQAGLLGLPGSNGTAGNALAAYQQFTQTPYYQFPLQIGTQAMDASGAARGLALSGGQLNAIQSWGQNYASGNLGNYLNALGALAGSGQSAAATIGGQGNQAAGTIGNANAFGGNAAAAGATGQATAFNTAANNISGIFGNGQAGNSGLLSNPQFQSWLSGSNTSYGGGGSAGGVSPMAGGGGGGGSY